MTASKTAETTGAVGQMLGYLYQLERALLWLSLCTADGMVSIETQDDVVARLRNGENITTIFEQDKSTLGTTNPFSDKSVNLWKTLCIWLDLVNTEGIDLSSSRFILCATVPIKRKCLVTEISQCGTEEEIRKVISKARNIASKANKTIGPYCEKFSAASDTTIGNLFRRISLVENVYHDSRTTLKKKVKSNLRISEDVPFQPIYERLVGWVTETVISQWIAGKSATLTTEIFWSIKDDLIRRYGQQKFIEKTTENLPISESLIRSQKGKVFVRQLELIDLDEVDTIDCINDYLRSSMERTRYAAEGRITASEFDEFDNSLMRRWSSISKRKIRLNRDDNESDLGFDIYSETMDFKGKLAGVQTEQDYTTKGTYHRLSNEKRLGWHPRWRNEI